MTSRRKNAEAIYRAAATWRGKCLLNDGSLFGDDRLWTKENFSKDFAEIFETHKRVEGLMPRLLHQLEDLGQTHCKLAAEMFWAMYLADDGAAQKEKVIKNKMDDMQSIADLSGSDLPANHEFLQDNCLRGIGGAGRNFGINFWFEMMCFILCMREIKHFTLAERKQLLVDGNGEEFSRLWDEWPEKWRMQWKEKWWDTHARSKRGMSYVESCHIRHMLLHLLFPDHFEPAFNAEAKHKIIWAFKSLRTDKMSWSEKDEVLRVIRAEKEDEYGRPFDFYKPEVRSIWSNAKQPSARKSRKEIPEKQPKNPEKTMSNIPLNQIFYGPPGTGKTYGTISATLKILDNKRYQEKCNDPRALKKLFDKFKEKGRIGFVTFHQSFGYEEFVEGIRPTMDDANDNVLYEVKNGIFKDMCKRAGSTEIALRFEDAIEKLKRACAEEAIGLKTATKKEFTIRYRGGKTFRCKPKDSDRDGDVPVNIENIKKVYGGAKAKDFYSPSYTPPIIDHIKDKYNLDENVPTGPLKSPRNDGGDSNPYVLIIDEINRGNISRIFGELITLIEGSRRIGNDEETTVALPLSPKEPFGVPNNLYIIGTMNTADRSIALLDTALRRRFRFVEMMPDLSVLNDIPAIHGIEVKKLLAKMNERIEALYDRDHQIGHSYFLRLKKQEHKNIETLADIFQHEVLPLLQEYFYDDWKKINLVLNNNKFIQHTSPPVELTDAVGSDKKIWSINAKVFEDPSEHVDHYLAIYDNAARDRLKKSTSDGDDATG